MKFNDAFWRWFGKSKVVNDRGAPLVVYHGTTADFSSFDPFKSFDGGFHFGTPDAAMERLKYWTSEGIQRGHEPRVMPVYLSIDNPLYLDYDPFDEESWAGHIYEAKTKGHDGIAYPNAIEGGNSWVAFYPHQIKSALANDGTWDDDRDIMSNRAASTNPPWADKILRRNFAALDAWLTAHGHHPDLWLPVSQDALFATEPVEEYGCGHYGCVYPTADSQMVFKLTTDQSEALFVALVLELARRGVEPPDGIVRYYGIVQLAEKYKSRPVYALWREASGIVGLGALVDHFTGDAYAWNQLHLTERHLLMARIPMHYARALAMKQAKGADYWPWVARQWELLETHWEQLADQLERAEADTNKILRYEFHMSGTGAAMRRADLMSKMPPSNALRMPWLLYLSQQYIEALQNENFSSQIGNAMRQFFERRVVMADIHANNIGLVERPDEYAAPLLVITDPGHVQIMDPELAYPPLEVI